MDWQKSYDKKYRNEERSDVDLKTFKNEILWMDEECKNWKNPTNQYGLPKAQSEVIERFKNSKAKYKVLSIPNFNVFNWKARKQIISKGIKIFETGKLIGSKDFRSHSLYVKRMEFIKYLLTIDA